mmetsp:Transcript_22002/g.43733  ORF Transcript_22002/g.43733 Transcript_22002/m.43733 type:complete len:233 (+) Transcript_22002:2039-2737(+)
MQPFGDRYILVHKISDSCKNCFEVVLLGLSSAQQIKGCVRVSRIILQHHCHISLVLSSVEQNFVGPDVADSYMRVTFLVPDTNFFTLFVQNPLHFCSPNKLDTQFVPGNALPLETFGTVIEFKRCLLLGIDFNFGLDCEQKKHVVLPQILPLSPRSFRKLAKIDGYVGFHHCRLCLANKRLPNLFNFELINRDGHSAPTSKDGIASSVEPRNKSVDCLSDVLADLVGCFQAI